MIPFLSTQLERGAGASAHEVRPVVPSMFEPLSPVADTLTDEGTTPLALPVATDFIPRSSPLGDQTRGHPSHDPDLSRRLAQPAASETMERSAHTGQIDPRQQGLPVPQRQLTPPPVPPLLASTTARPFDASRRSDEPRVPLIAETTTQPNAVDPFHSANYQSESQRVHRLAEDVERLSRRLGTPAPSKSPEPAIRPVTAKVSSPPRADSTSQRSNSESRLIVERPVPLGLAPQQAVPQIELPPTPAPTPPLADSTGQRSNSESRLIVERPIPVGLVPQQAVPQIELPHTPAPTPTVTVSIGRIEFRHSSRRSDPVPSPAPSPQRPASRVVSLEDYLLQKSAGAS